MVLRRLPLLSAYATGILTAVKADRHCRRVVVRVEVLVSAPVLASDPAVVTLFLFDSYSNYHSYSDSIVNIFLLLLFVQCPVSPKPETSDAARDSKEIVLV